SGLSDRIAASQSTNLCANLSLAFQEATLEAALRALFSLPDSAERAHITAMARYYLAGPGRPNLFDAFASTTESFGFALRSRRRFQKAWSSTIDAIVSARRERSGTTASADFLDLLLAARDPETGQALSQVEVRDQCSTMIVAGYETTARLLFWAAYLLTLDLTEQDRLRAELASFPPERVNNLDDLLNWPRLRQVLFEALRLYPPAAYISREATAEDVVAGEPVSVGRRPGSARGCCTVTASTGTVRRHSRLTVSRASFRRGLEAVPSCHLAPARASASAQHSPWRRRTSCWRRCCRGSGSRSMPHARCCPLPESRRRHPTS